MKNIKDLKIIGIDSARPPLVRSEPYIDLVFQLSDKASIEWCQDFNLLLKDAEYNVNVDIADCIYIKTWVREMSEIAEHLEDLKLKVAECNQNYLDREKKRAQAAIDASSVSVEGVGAQGQLNDIIAGLNFD